MTKAPTIFPYRNVFEAIERALINRGSPSIESSLNAFKSYGSRTLSDEEYFSILVLVTFYSGFRASIVSAKKNVIREYFPSVATVASYKKRMIRRIMADTRMIRNERKIIACIENATALATIIKKYGSMKQYIDSHAPFDPFENLMLLKESLEATFSYLGGVTVYHFMTDIGLPVLKPDRVICRIFKRLDLIQDERQLLKTVIQGRKFAEATGHPIRYIDRVLVAHGQASTPEYSIEQGVCLAAPRCGVCPIVSDCNYGLSRKDRRK